MYGFYYRTPNGVYLSVGSNLLTQHLDDKPVSIINCQLITSDGLCISSVMSSDLTEQRED